MLEVAVGNETVVGIKAVAVKDAPLRDEPKKLITKCLNEAEQELLAREQRNYPVYSMADEELFLGELIWTYLILVAK